MRNEWIQRPTILVQMNSCLAFRCFLTRTHTHILFLSQNFKTQMQIACKTQKHILDVCFPHEKQKQHTHFLHRIALDTHESLFSQLQQLGENINLMEILLHWIYIPFRLHFFDEFNENDDKAHTHTLKKWVSVCILNLAERAKSMVDDAWHTNEITSTNKERKKNYELNKQS